MKANRPKLHHYLPRMYLRPFADENEHLVLRRRGSGPVNATVGTVCAVNNLYTVVLPDGSRDVSAEETLCRLEGMSVGALRSLRELSIPRRGSDDRQAVALFLAFQSLRTPEHADRYRWVTRLVENVGTNKPTSQQVRDYLREEHLGFDPGPREVTGAHSIVMAAVADGLPTQSDHLAFMFDQAVKRIAPLLSQMTWSLECCRKPRFVTADRLPAGWSRPVEADAYRGVGLQDAEELWTPLDPSTLLVLRAGGNETVKEVEPKRARHVNAFLANHCYQTVVHHPGLKVGDGELKMAARRPSVRFSSGSGMTEGPRGELVPLGQVFHSWVPIRDDI